MNRQLVAASFPVGLAIVMAATFITQTGPLDPPPGPIQPTNRVQLNEQWVSLPYTIDTPGSYVLTSNLTGVAGQHGIVIQADNVTLDLNGFALLGVPGSLNGILMSGLHFNISVSEGTIRDWGGDGVASPGGARSSRLHALRACNNGGNGLVIGEGGVISECTAENNGATGIIGAGASTISYCTALSNAGTGIYGSDGSTIIGCAAADNSRGIAVSLGTIRDCTAFNNNGVGIRVYGGIVSHCTATLNDDHGIDAIDEASTVVACTSWANGGVGIRVEDSLVCQNASRDNTGGNFVDFGASTVCADNHF